MPSRKPTSAIEDPTAGLTYSGVAAVQSPEFTIPVSVSSQPLARTETSPPPRSPFDSAGLAAPKDNPNARTLIAAVQSPTPTSQATAGAPDCDRSQSTLYCVYTVSAGDTLSGIATKFGLKGAEVPSWQLLVNSNRPDITSENDILQVGQKMRIPLGNGVIHTVLSAETLSDIAEQYGVAVADIVAANGIADSNNLTIGQEVLVPNPERFQAPAPPPTPTPTAAPRTTGGTGGTTTARTGPASRAGFIWPVTGPISSYFGPSHPLGIDIDLYATPNAPIGAAAAGTVTFAGGNTCCSYGLYVIVDHGNGFQTLYGHLSSISVSVGQKVSQGTIVGNGGRTGYATGNHLHFEVRLNGSVVNPLSYLP